MAAGACGGLRTALLCTVSERDWAGMPGRRLHPAVAMREWSPPGLHKQPTVPGTAMAKLAERRSGSGSAKTSLLYGPAPHVRPARRAGPPYCCGYAGADIH